MKKQFTRRYLVPLVLVVLLTLLNGRVLFGPGVPYTHDGENHLARFANYFLAVQERQLPPRFAPQLMNRYGYPVFNYNYPLANLVSLPFSYAGLEYEQTYKIILFASLAIGFLGLWLWLSQLEVPFKSRVVALALFGTTPYLASAIAFRGNVGEVMVMALIPWVLLSVELIKTRSALTRLGILLMSVVSITAFMLAHNVGAAFGLPLILIYGVWRFRGDWSFWRQFLSLILVSVGLSLWFWLPALAEKNQVVLDKAAVSNLAYEHTVSLSQLLFSPLQFGFSYAGGIDSMSFGLGLAQALVILVIGLGMIRELRHRKINQDTLLVVGIWVLVLLQLNFSASIWKIVPLISFIQFPWRLSLFLPFLVSLIVARKYQQWPRSLKYLLTALIVIQLVVLSRISALDRFHHLGRDYEAFGQSTTTLNENMPKTFTYLLLGDWQPGPSILAGEGEIAVQSWLGSRRSYQVMAATSVTVTEPTMNFLGWKSMATDAFGQRQELSYVNDDQIQGRIAYRLEPGVYQIESTFTQRTWARMVGNNVSVVTAGLLAVYSGWLGWKRWLKFRKGS